MKNVLDILLQSEIPAPQTQQLKVKRLSKLAGEDVVVTIRELGYSRVAQIRKLHEDDPEMEVHTLLAGVVEPDLKSKELLAKYSAATPAELVKKLFLPGEIADLSRAVERLSGYLTMTLEEVKKK